MVGSLNGMVCTEGAVQGHVAGAWYPQVPVSAPEHYVKYLPADLEYALS